MSSRRSLSLGWCALFALLFTAVAAAQTPPDYRILINTYQFDPLEQQPDLTDALRIDPGAITGDSTYRLIQFRRPLTRSERALLQKEYGLRLSSYIPNLAYAEYIANEQIPALEKLPYFRWSGLYQPAYKVAPRIGQSEFISEKRRAESGYVLLLQLRPGAGSDRVVEQLPAGIVTVLQAFANGRIRVRINDLDQLPVLARIPAVIWIEEEGDITTDNGGVAGLIQSNNATNTPIHNNNIRGEGQIVGLIDAPLDLNHCFFNDPANANANPAHRKVIGYRTDNPTTFATAAGCISGHGTHTGGTIAGFSTGDANNGIAFNARLTYGDLGDLQFSTGSGTRTFLEYLNAASGDGAFIHSNSWSDKASGVVNAYSLLSQDLDRFTWNNENHLVVVSSGNNIDTDGDGISDTTSPIRPPFSAKNGLSVAASSEGNTNNVSTGASGPTFDNRIKPDIYAPGSNTTSSRAGTNCGTIACSGSSMATPAVAGAAALVRQYYLDGWYPSGTTQPHHSFTPSGALLKATLLNSTRDMTGNDAFGSATPLNGYPSNLEGWGGLVLDDALYFRGDARNLWAWDIRHVSGLLTGEQHAYSVDVVRSTQPLKITLNWTEPPAASAAFGNPVINDLDLRVIAPDGTVYRGNDFTAGQSRGGSTTTDAVNNVEMVLRTTPQTGVWRIEVTGTTVNLGNPGQGYALVATADTQDPPVPTGDQNLLVVRTDVPGANPGGAPAVTQAQALVTDLADYITEVSYGQTTINASFPTVTLTTPLGTYLASDSNPLIEMAEDVVAELLAANPNVFNQGTADPADDIDRIMVLINDTGFTGDWATTGPWPYTLPDGLTQRISVSISSVFNDPERRLNHALCHQLGLVDLYNHPGVVFAQPHVDNWDIMANVNTVQPMAWSKERAEWLSTHDPGSIRWVPRPAAGASFNQTIPLNWLASRTTDNPRAIAIGVTPGVANLADEDVFYFIEARTTTVGDVDATIPEDNGVLLYYVNEDILQGEGPVRIIDQDLTTPNSLDDAAFGLGSIPPPDGTGIEIEVLAPTGSEAFRIQLDYDPPETTNDVNIVVGTPHWTSPDIWVDNQRDGYDEDEGRTPLDRGDAPIAGEDNRIYFTIHNPGPGTAFDVTVAVRVSEPYHTLGDGPDFNRFVQQKTYPSIAAGADITDYVIWRPNTGDDPHSCIKVEIQTVFNDINDYNNSAQQNVTEEESTTASPYEPVTYDFSVTNPYDYYQLFYFRLEGLPAGWTYAFAEDKRRLSAHERYEGTLTVTPPDDARVCTDHELFVTSWMPRGNTLVPYGGTTLQVALRNRTTLTADTRLVPCQDKPVTYNSYAAAYETRKTYRPKCYRVVTQGCTDPVRANEEIILRYEGPDGNPVYRVVTTDELGCYSDTYVVTEGGEWRIEAIYEGDDCSGSTTTGRRPIAVPLPTGADPGSIFPGGNKRWWISAHAGSTHPLGNLNDRADANIYAAADLTTQLTDRTSLTFTLGLAQMTSESSSGADHPRWLHLSANYEVHFPRPNRMKPYLRLGPGIYRDKSGTNTTGVNLGIGGRTVINNELILTPGLDFHYVGFGQDNQQSFLTMHLGFLFK